MRLSLILTIFLNIAATAVGGRENPIVRTRLGRIQGSYLTTRLRRTIYAFTGIRYAQPPIGNLRFRPPVPVEKWQGVYNATVDGPMCPQPGEELINEDCLILNVYTTKLPDDGFSHSRRPVVVYIHGGAFYSGSSHSTRAGPQYFLDRDIVLVTINYRLGSLGFLSTGRDVPGNNGLRDQVLALKWIRDHVEAFGGDRKSVTLLGSSAGGVSINLHLVSPMTRGLFHKAILSSGAATGPFQFPTNQLGLAQKQARLVGCPDDVGPKRMVECLRGVPAKTIADSLPGFFEFGLNPGIIWFPVVEEDHGQERFLTEDWAERMQRGDFEQIPIVAGVTKDEVGAVASPLVANETLLNLLSEDFNTYAPVCFLYERDTPRSRRVSKAVRKFYLGDGPLTVDSSTALGKIYSDAVIGFPTNRFLNLLAQKRSRKAYYYEFRYQGRFSHIYLPGSNNTVPFGVVHFDDLMYILYISSLFPFFDETFPEVKIVERMTLLWATFAKTGKPISRSNHDFRGTNWKAYDTCGRNYLEIGDEMNLKHDLHPERYDLWKSLYPIHGDGKLLQAEI